MKIKNLIIFIVFKILNFITHKNEIDLRSLKILILSTTGLGDTLWATPFLKELKKKFPYSNISFFTTNLGKQILENNPNIDTFFIYKKHKIISLIRQLKKQKIQIVFHIHTSQRMVLPIASVIGAEKIIGYQNKTKGLDFLLTDYLLEEKVHEIQKRLNLLKFLKISAKVSPPQYYFGKSFEVKEKASGVNILIHPGAKDRYKQWPIESYLMLAKMYIKAYSANVFFSLGPHDMHIKSVVINSDEPFLIIENKSIDEFAREISIMKLVVTNDTGPMHLSAAINIPTIGIFSTTDPKISGPIGLNALAAYRKKTCTPCLQRKCNEPFCFYQISPANIFKITRRYLD